MRNRIFYIIIFLFTLSLLLSNNYSNKETQNEKLIFIYNASDDMLSVSFDFMHKILSPSTYQCSLCKVTYGNFRMHDKWKKYIKNSNYDFEFLYKNNYMEYHEDLSIEELPVSYKYDGNSYELFISKKEFDLCPNLDSLIEIIDQKLNKD